MGPTRSESRDASHHTGRLSSGEAAPRPRPGTGTGRELVPGRVPDASSSRDGYPTRARPGKGTGLELVPGRVCDASSSWDGYPTRARPATERSTIYPSRDG